MTLRTMLLLTYQNPLYRNRFKYKARDVMKYATVNKKTDLKSGETKFYIESYSFPQYYPYYTGKTARNERIQYQRQFRHEYDSTIVLDRLSIDADFRGRLGAQGKWNRNAKPAKRIKKRKEVYITRK